jgi:membrane protein required for beta-lactamase induction
MVRVVQIVTQSSERAGEAWRNINAQPSWIVRASLIAFILVVVIPIVLLVMFAFLVASLLFGLLWLVHRAMSGFRGLFPGRDGRANVRVIVRRDDV